MEPAFWLKKWQAHEIGFHQTDIHPLLLAHWAALGFVPGQRVLVPLCGKSRDLSWLAARGLEVIGFELSELAVQAFFREHELEPCVVEVDSYVRFSAPGMTIFCGDFFQVSLASCAPCDAVYDRAALIALSPTQREPYLNALRRLCRSQARGLLITVEYPDGVVSAPPFSIPRSEIEDRYRGWARLEELERRAADVKGQPALEVAYAFGLSGS